MPGVLPLGRPQVACPARTYQLQCRHSLGAENSRGNGSTSLNQLERSFLGSETSATKSLPKAAGKSAYLIFKSSVRPIDEGLTMNYRWRSIAAKTYGSHQCHVGMMARDTAKAANVHI